MLGYNLSKSDLTHIFIEGQKVSLEGVELQNPKTHNEEKVNYWSARVWTSKFIPRNVNKTVPESSHVNNWLKKRNLSFEKFKLLVDGKLPPVPEEIATINKSNMLKGGTDTLQVMEAHTGVGTEMDGLAMMSDGTYPVFKHGPEASRICDLALSVTGPKDPNIAKIILNDDNAQMAFHLCKTLETALERYKRLTEPESTTPAKRSKPSPRKNPVDQANKASAGNNTPAKANKSPRNKPVAAAKKASSASMSTKANRSPRNKPAAKINQAASVNPAPVIWASDWANSGRTSGNGYSNAPTNSYTPNNSYVMPYLMPTGFGHASSNSGGYTSTEVNPWGQSVAPAAASQYSYQDDNISSVTASRNGGGGGRASRGIKRKYDHGNDRRAEASQHFSKPRGNIQQPKKRAGGKGGPRGGGPAKRGKFHKRN